MIKPRSERSTETPSTTRGSRRIGGATRARWRRGKLKAALRRGGGEKPLQGFEDVFDCEGLAADASNSCFQGLLHDRRSESGRR